MKNVEKIVFVIGIMFITNTFTIAQLPDPKEILQKAVSALQNIISITYQAEEYSIGTVKFGDTDAILTPHQGKVLFVRSTEDEFFGGKAVIEGELVRTTSERTNSKFKVVYDGKKIRKIDYKRKIVYVNDPDQKGMGLLIGAADLVLKDFRVKEPLQHTLNAENVRYDGVAVVGGKPCHIIHAFFANNSSLEEKLWFFSVDDYLPRKVQTIGGGGIISVVTLNEMKLNIEINPSTFFIDAPEEYSVEVYQGFGKSQPALSNGDLAPDWTLYDSQNNPHYLIDFRGKLVVIDFWATWCGPCRMVIPFLQKIHEEYKDKDVIVIGINTYESGDPAKFMLDKGYTYRLLLNGDEVAKEYRVNSIPTLYIVGPDGKILYGEVGYRPESYPKLEQIIKDNITKK